MNKKTGAPVGINKDVCRTVANMGDYPDDSAFEFFASFCFLIYRILLKFEVWILFYCSLSDGTLTRRLRIFFVCSQNLTILEEIEEGDC
jgi:hypothetical protein